MVIKDRGIVLRSIDFQDTSKIVSLLTAEHGKITVLAKGAKSPKSKFAGLIQAGNALEIMYYFKESREIQLLSDASYELKAYPIYYDMDKLALLMPSLEMVNLLINDQENSADFFNFLWELIRWILDEKLSVRCLFPYILIRLADLSGIALQFDDEAYDRQKTYFLNGNEGLISDTADSGLAIRLLPMQSFYLFLACNRKGKRILDLAVEETELNQLTHHLDVYFKQHFDVWERRSDEIFKSL